MLENNWLDGIILNSVADSEEHEYFKHLSNLGNDKKHIPVVSLERRMDSYGIASVVVNNRQGGNIATSHLIECGCRKIVNITGPLGSCVVQDRIQGYKDILVKQGILVEETSSTG